MVNNNVSNLIEKNELKNECETKTSSSIEQKKIYTGKFSNRGTRTVKFNTGLVKFSALYAKTNFWFKISFSAFLGLIMSFLTLLLVQNTGLYTGGITAMFQGVARLAFVGLTKSVAVDAGTATLIYDALFWGLYLGFNIPLFIFAYFKINKQFAILSAVYLIVLQGLGFVWSTAIPGMNDVAIFGDTNTVDMYLQSFNVNVLLFQPNVVPVSLDGGDYWNIEAWKMARTPLNTEKQIVATIATLNATRFGLLLLYSVVFSFCTASTYSLLYITGSSSAGSDFISIFYSQEKNKPLGKIMITIALSCMLMGIFLGSYVSSMMVDPTKYSGWQYFLSGNLIASLLWVVLNGTLIDKIFPWHKLSRVEIYTDQISLVRERLLEENYIHPTTIIDAIGGYSQQSKKIMVTICMVVEIPKLIKVVREIDKNCLISTSFIADLDGIMKMQKQTG